MRSPDRWVRTTKCSRPGRNCMSTMDRPAVTWCFTSMTGCGGTPGGRTAESARRGSLRVRVSVLGVRLSAGWSQHGPLARAPGPRAHGLRARAHLVRHGVGRGRRRVPNRSRSNADVVVLQCCACTTTPPWLAGCRRGSCRTTRTPSRPNARRTAPRWLDCPRRSTKPCLAVSRSCLPPSRGLARLTCLAARAGFFHTDDLSFDEYLHAV